MVYKINYIFQDNKDFKLNCYFSYMDFENILNRNPNLTLEDLQELQRTYDSQFVAQKGFVGFDKVRHTYAHMGKLIGRLAQRNSLVAY